MSLEGLRAWIGEVERKLGKRTRVFLVLTVIAIGIGGAAIYLAIDARESSVSESDVQALQEQLETRIDEVAAGAAAAPPEAPVEAESAPAPQPEESTPKPESEKKGKSDDGSSGPGGGSTGSVPNGATGGAATSTKLQELVQQAKERARENE
jgi:hypothetical protein